MYGIWQYNFIQVLCHIKNWMSQQTNPYKSSMRVTKWSNRAISVLLSCFNWLLVSFTRKHIIQDEIGWSNVNMKLKEMHETKINKQTTTTKQKNKTKTKQTKNNKQTKKGKKSNKKWRKQISITQQSCTNSFYFAELSKHKFELLVMPWRSRREPPPWASNW